MSDRDALAQFLSQAIESRHISLETIVERTKVTKPTLRTFLGATDPALLPSRVYLRGHLRIVAKYLELEEGEILSLFDRAFPDDADDAPTADGSGISRTSWAFAAGLAGLGVLAIVLSIVAA